MTGTPPQKGDSTIPPANPDIHIMIVEDERIVALHLRQQLTRLGYGRVTVHSAGAKALEAILSDTPDLILMDIHIDGDIDGIETAAGIPPYMHVPVIYLSAYSEDQTLERAKLTHPYGYLIKPFSERELHATIQMALQRRKVEFALKRSEERLYLAMKAANMTCWEIDIKTRQIETADPIGIIHPDGDAASLSADLDKFLERVAPEDQRSVKCAFETAIKKGDFFDVIFRAKEGGSSVSWFRAQGKTFEGTPQNPRRIIGVVQDITDQRVAGDRLRQATTVYETSQDGILILDQELRITSANRSYANITGIPIEEALGHRPHVISRETFPLSFYREMFKSLESRKHWHREIDTLNADGEQITLMAQIIAVDSDDGDVSHYVAIISDRTAIRRAEEELQYLAHYDGLTGLPNRLLAIDRLGRAIERASDRGTTLACMFIDIDNFKNINDTLGHGAGDQLLVVVSRRLKALINSTDTVARLGGDEFLITAEDIKNEHAAAAMAARLLKGLQIPASIASRDISVTASIGISLFPDTALGAQDMVRQADTAMYAAKNGGRNGFAFYKSAMTEDASHFMTRSLELRRGLENGELVLFYQPQYCRQSGKMSGVEALIRWNHPTEGLLGPGEIIPVAEQSGLINEIGQWVVEEACAQAMRWREEGHKCVRVAVNVSVRQLRSDDFVDVVRTALALTEIPPQSLELEITESMIQDDARIISRLHDLRKLGVSLAIDDFGTGFSCLGSIKSLPIKRIKIDQSFVRGIPEDRDNTALTEAIIALGRKLGMAVTVEGVEEQAQLEFLQQRDCTDFQGYYFCRPVPAAQIFNLPAINVKTS
ncbi:EAL domain-containing protein [Thalassospira marina]|uniref:Two-component system response regulator n=1 Tax=Thalassospira marina TaxID=2048283 RepID=A0A2N3KZM2_9PROT|nr:EAL domain-containing protein [Thalassospira marina]PKR56022.1 two-component system response regulator [Thalassospira marina]